MDLAFANMIDLDMDQLSEQSARHSAEVLPGEFSCFTETLPFVLPLFFISSWTARLGIDQDAGVVAAHPCDGPRGKSESAPAT